MLAVVFGVLVMLLVPLGVVAMKEGGIWLAVTIVDGLAAILFLILSEKEGNRLAEEWIVVASGIYHHVVYGKHTESRRSGAMVHTTHYYEMKVTVLYFTDGRTCVLGGRRDIDFPSGTNVRVIENGLGQRKIEKIENR